MNLHCTYFGKIICLPVILIIFSNIPADSAIQCYKCLVAPPTYYTNETIKLCKDFDYSDKFIVNCKYSTFCVKKITSAKIPVPINGTERDCASQKLETQNLQNGKWHPKITIEEPYKEGCALVNDKGLRTSSIEYCYCRGELCNASAKYSSLGIFLLSVICLGARYL